MLSRGDLEGIAKAKGKLMLVQVLRLSVPLDFVDTDSVERKVTRFCLYRAEAGKAVTRIQSPIFSYVDANTCPGKRKLR